MSTPWPKVISRRKIDVSPWMHLIAREIEFAPGADPQIYHAVGQSDYLVVLAVTPDGRIPLVSQYRPAIERVSLELPAGLLERGEEPAAAAARELLEETGFPVADIQPVGVSAACPGRLGNRVHSFFVQTGHQIADFSPEPGLAVA